MIIPSLMAADLLNLAKEVDAIIAAGLKMVHLDIMDNNYVPNLTFGPMFCEALAKQYPKLSLDVHIMASGIDSLIEKFAKAKATRISIHHDASHHLDRSLQKIRELGCKAGLALNPADSVDIVKWVAHRLDFVLVMTVNPGFAGQPFIEPVLEKIKELKDLYPDLVICVDGGINLHYAKVLSNLGVTECISGSDFFKVKDYKKQVLDYQKALGW